MKTGLSLIALALAAAVPATLAAQVAPAEKAKPEKAEDVVPQVHTTRLSGTFGGQKIGYAAAVSVILILLTLILTLIQVALARRWVFYAGATPGLGGR